MITTVNPNVVRNLQQTIVNSTTRSFASLWMTMLLSASPSLRTQPPRHSERSEESPTNHRELNHEILRFALDDNTQTSATFQESCKCRIRISSHSYLSFFFIVFSKLIPVHTFFILTKLIVTFF